MASIGFLAFRWLFIATFAIASWLMIQAQMRNVGFKRNYASPSDIVSDRFHSKSLSAVAAGIWVAQLFITITAQMYALHDIIDGLSLGRLHAKAMTWGICFIVLFCEVVGGQRSVSLSDAIQAGIMLTAFFFLPFVLIYNYGGCSKSPLATENLLETPDGVLWPHQCSLGTAACYLLAMLTRAILMPSLFQRRVVQHGRL